MRVAEVTKPGGPEVLSPADRAVPTAESDSVVIRVGFAGVNFANLGTRLDPSATPGGVPGIEVAGRVHELGSDVKGLEIGDRVIGLPYFTHGGYAEYVAVPATHVVRVPDDLGLDVAALGDLVNYLTAYIGLVRVAQVREGDLVLVHAAAGGVGLAAVQLAAASRARVIATASPPKHEFLRRQPSVQAVIDYNEPDWTSRFDGYREEASTSFSTGSARTTSARNPLPHSAGAWPRTAILAMDELERAVYC